ncbi:hypothetical protein ACFU6S_18785 [Streptomyces sp. NPDC057456]|uniref:hypothetical protein n=1 Tax=Streptomyces sp. NPDC057456 TaxID=3346139 RepID=UPI0036C4E7D0
MATRKTTAKKTTPEDPGATAPEPTDGDGQESEAEESGAQGGTEQPTPAEDTADAGTPADLPPAPPEDTTPGADPDGDGPDEPDDPDAQTPCPECFPQGWKPGATACGCEHGSWRRTASD